jgi:hypothetical protein
LAFYCIWRLKELSQQPAVGPHREPDLCSHIIIIIMIIILIASGFIPGGSGTTIRHNTQNNTPHSKARHTNLQKQ